jgi:hypothetical protein
MEQHIFIYFIARQLAHFPFINDDAKLVECYERDVTSPIERGVLFTYFSELGDPFALTTVKCLKDLPSPLCDNTAQHAAHIELLATLMARKLISTYTNRSYDHYTDDAAVLSIRRKIFFSGDITPKYKLKDGEVEFVCDHCGNRSLIVCYDATVRRYADEMGCATDQDGTQYFNYTHDYLMDPDVDTFDVLFFECDGCKKTWESEDELMASGCLKNVETKDNDITT